MEQMKMETNLLGQSRELGELLKEKGLTIATAESCTGGLLANIITAVPGSSEYFVGGVVAYSNDLKAEVLGVSHGTLVSHGAVSAEVAQEMAMGARGLDADIGVGITGIAGPGGGTEEKPVGLVYIAVSFKDMDEIAECRYRGERTNIKEQAVIQAMNMLFDVLQH